MATKFDFHKVAEDKDCEVYQSMELLKTKEMPNGETPRKYRPLQLKKVDASVVASALESFDGYDVTYIQVSQDGGVTVRVARGANNPYEPKEEGVTRLQPVKGGDK